MNFVAIDFETATFDRMACQVGMTIVKEGEIVDTYSQISGDLKQKDLTNADPNNPFYDKKVVITGVFNMDRNEMAARLKDMGADINGSISRKTNFVVVGEDAGPSKLQKIDTLKSQGNNIVVLHQDDIDKIFNGEWDDYLMKDEN